MIELLRDEMGEDLSDLFPRCQGMPKQAYSYRFQQCSLLLSKHAKDGSSVFFPFVRTVQK